ncbi:MAG: holo-ACP synthase [Saccharofermentans sp.]|nr:holo-ACP synthase [Saccharofermentans sp.]
MKVLSGIDSVYIPRIEKMLASSSSFIAKCFTDKEQETAAKFKSDKRIAEFYAGRYAAKEAASKALGTGIMTEGIGLKDFEILPDDKGAPQLVLHGVALQKTEERQITSMSISITHEEGYAAAFAVMLSNEEA